MNVSAFFMGKPLKHTVHFYFLLGYFLVNSFSLIIHESYVYATYELLFLLYLILGSVYAYKTKDSKSLIKQSLIAHIFLIVMYTISLFYVHNLGIQDPQSLLVLFPLGHFVISILLFFLFGLKKKANSLNYRS